ncbi:MAG: GNAT family N-acetyltransferase [Kofleriaceae bacterium]|nr:GNAT family N-acetyltransferase [Kofleriaceae bacterium]
MGSADDALDFELLPGGCSGRAMISTSRLLLRPFTVSDAPKLFVMSIEEGMRRWIPDQVYRDEQHAEQVARALMAFTAQSPDPGVRPYVLGIEDQNTGVLIGHVGLSAARGSVEIGYAIEQQLQGRGLATEAVIAMSGWALTELSLPEVLGIVEADNVHSCRVLEKAGFVLEDDEIKIVDGVSRTRRIYRCRQDRRSA